MKNRKGNDWFPMWVDKWLLGSTRHELLPDEQSVWIDFLALGAKDDGFIRANEETPYPLNHLAGLLYKTEELIQRTIDKCIAVKKMVLTEQKTLYICNFTNYELSLRHKRRLEENKPDMPKKADIVSPKADIVSPKADINKGIKNRIEENRIEENRIEDVPKTDILSVKKDIEKDIVSEKADIVSPEADRVSEKADIPNFGPNKPRKVPMRKPIHTIATGFTTEGTTRDTMEGATK